MMIHEQVLFEDGYIRGFIGILFYIISVRFALVFCAL